MLFGDIILFVDITLESRKYVALFHEVSAALALDSYQWFVRNPIPVRRSSSTFWRDGEIFQLFSKNDDGLL
jgi:hypothetical protein